jgi:hypothetical protein
MTQARHRLPRGLAPSESDYEYCGWCDHHADRHDYGASGDVLAVPCTECPNGICGRQTPEESP